MDPQTCDHKKCLTTYEASTCEPQKGECYICKGSIKELGMLKNCEHISCADCLRKKRQQDKCIKCPACNSISYTAVYARKVFKGEEKESLFRKHVRCLFGGDPTITKHLDDLDPEWLTLIETAASSEGHGLFGASLYTEGYSKVLDAEPILVTKSHATFRKKQNSEKSVIAIYCKIPNCLCLRVVLSPEPLFGRDHEDDYADEAVRWFNRQLASSWEAFPYIFREGAETCTLGRRFRGTYCAFKFRLLRFCPFKRLWKDLPEGEPAPMRDELGSIRLQNFRYDWRDVEKMLQGKFDFEEEVERGVFPLLHD